MSVQASEGNEGKQPQVQAELHALTEAVADLYAIITALKGRLSSVLRSAPPESTTEKSNPEPVLCEVASEIRGKRRLVDAAIEQVKSVIDRCEV